MDSLIGLLSVYLMSECMNGIAISFCKLSGKVEQPIRVNFRSSHQRRASFLKKVRGCKPATSLRKRLYHNCFLVNFERFLRTPFYGTHPRDCFCKFISINKLVIHWHRPQVSRPHVLKSINWGFFFEHT